MMVYTSNNYKKSLLFSLLLHAVIALFLLTSIALPLHPFNHMQLSHAQQKTKIVTATAVNQQQVQQEVAKLKRQQQAKTKAKQRALEKLQHQARLAKKAKQRAQRETAKLRVESKRLCQQQLRAQKRQQKRLAKLKQQQAQVKKQVAAQKAKQWAKALAKERAQQAAKQLRQQQLAAEQKQLNNAKAKYVASAVAKYKALILNKMQQNWLVPANVTQNLSCVLLIKLAPGGTVLNVELVRSSGNPALDRSAIAAIYKASPLPVPQATDLFNYFREIDLTVRPEKRVG